MTRETVRLSVYLSPEEDACVRRIAERHRIKINDAMRRAVTLLDATETAREKGHVVGTSIDGERIHRVFIAA